MLETYMAFFLENTTPQPDYILRISIVRHICREAKTGLISGFALSFLFRCARRAAFSHAAREDASRCVLEAERTECAAPEAGRSPRHRSSLLVDDVFEDKFG